MKQYNTDPQTSKTYEKVKSLKMKNIFLQANKSRLFDVETSTSHADVELRRSIP